MDRVGSEPLSMPRPEELQNGFFLLAAQLHQIWDRLKAHSILSTALVFFHKRRDLH